MPLHTLVLLAATLLVALTTGLVYTFAAVAAYLLGASSFLRLRSTCR